MSEQWILCKEKEYSFKFRKEKIFNMLLNDSMYNKLESIVGAKKVRDTISEIVYFGLQGLNKIKKDIDGWLLFQNLLEKNRKDNNQTETSDNTHSKKKNRKHKHHFTAIALSREAYIYLKKYHHALNTFSVALLIRIFIQIFIDLYDLYKDVKITLNKLQNAFLSPKNKEKCEINFVFFTEKLATNKNICRIVPFIEIKYKDRKFKFTHLYRL